MAPPKSRNRESTPDNTVEEVESRYRAITKEACISRQTIDHVWDNFAAARQKFSLEGDMMEWLLPGAYALAISQKPVNMESKVILIKLLKATGLNVFSFYGRVKKWVDLMNLSTIARDIINQSERYFQISRSVFERFEQMFTCVFCDPLDKTMLKMVEERTMSLRKKQKTDFSKDVQAVEVYVFAWTLFIRLRRASPVIRDDPLSCYNLMICVLDLIRSNILAMKRPELFNLGCTILPDLKQSQEEPADKDFSLLPYLCLKFGAIHHDCHTLYVNGFLPLLKRVVDERDLICEGPGFLELMTPDNFVKNLKSMNSSYETFIRIGCAADERIFLVSQDIDAPGVGGDYDSVLDVLDTMKERRKIFPAFNRKLELNDFKTPTPVIQSPLAVPTPLTPSSSCSALERRAAQESIKSPPLQAAADLVTHLTNLVAGRTHLPSAVLKEAWLAVNEVDLSEEYVARAASFREKFVTAYVTECDPSGLAEPYIRQRFMFAQIWYFKLLEDMLVSEKKRGLIDNAKLKKVVSSEDIQISLYALAVEMVLFSYNCSKMFPWPIEVLEVTPYTFVKVIEPVVLLEQLPKSIIKHLGRIEETIREQLVWKSDSPVWADITSDDGFAARDVCWPHHLEETPSLTGQGNSDGNQSRRIAPVMEENRVAGVETVVKPARKSARSLFFRKIYGLAGMRLRELCTKLGFDAEIERKHHVFQRMFTLFESAITQHTDILKDRHLDQILLCCAYVVAKLESSNGLERSFHMIMNAYRNQPQAESRVYRSVLITPSQCGGVTASKEVRADIITFYNKVFVLVMQDFIAKFSPKKKGATLAVALSPVPRAPSRDTRRQIHPAAKIYMSPRKIEPAPPPPPSNGRVLTFTFGVTGQIGSVVTANSAAASARKVLQPAKRVAPMMSQCPAILTGPPPPKRPKLRKTPILPAVPARLVTPSAPVRRASVETRAAAASPSQAIANSLPPPLAEPPNFPADSGDLFSANASAYQDVAMPDSL